MCIAKFVKTTDGEKTSFDYTNIKWQDQLTSVNGVITNYETLGGTVVAQSDGIDKLYFQYNNGEPFGFVLNETQYFYLTNLRGDIAGITDSDGNLIAEYEYDEWGKLLTIETAEKDNAEQLAIAKINPLRYRGYYYDNETGMYYLQSRYYAPELCRFISADSFNYVDNNAPLNVNAYAYCVNNPVNYSDPSGNYPVVEKLESLRDKIESKFIALIKKTIEFAEKINDKIEQRIDKIKKKLESIKNRIMQKVNAYFTKIRNRLHLLSDTYTIVSTVRYSANEKDNVSMAIIQGLIGGIELQWIDDFLKAIGKKISKDLSLESISKLFKNQDDFADFSRIFLTVWNVFWDSVLGYIDTSASVDALSLSNYLFKELDTAGDYLAFIRGWGVIGSLIQFVYGMDNPISNFSTSENIVLNLVNLFAGLASVILIDSGWGFLVPAISNLVIRVIILIKNDDILY